MTLRMKPLAVEHDQMTFHCGDDALDRYFQQQAGQDMKRHVATVIVATRDDSTAVLGYYTLSASSVDLCLLPDATRKKLPRYGHVPAVLLGRLAVAEEIQGTGLGGLLLADAVRCACGGDVAWAILIVRAKHDRCGGIGSLRKYGC